jgi:anti-sigma regulatory factor (Ser/Thr protein kinase)
VASEVLFLSAMAASARAARQAVDQLPFDHDQEARLNVRLLVTELVTNSVRHAGLSAADSIRLELEMRDGSLWVAVTDSGPGFDRPAFAGPPEGVSGRGLHLVDVLADRWGLGQARDGLGWTVWFEIDLDEQLPRRESKGM